MKNARNTLVATVTRLIQLYEEREVKTWRRGQRKERSLQILLQSLNLTNAQSSWFFSTTEVQSPRSCFFLTVNFSSINTRDFDEEGGQSFINREFYFHKFLAEALPNL